MTLLTLSKPGLDPQLTSMSSNGTELKTIDVITLQKKKMETLLKMPLLTSRTSETLFPTPCWQKICTLK